MASDAPATSIGTARAAARILVVDAEPNATSALAELLRDEGYEVCCAGNGASAQETLQKLHPDLLLTGLQLPAARSLEQTAAQLSTTTVRMLARGQPSADDSPVLIKPIDMGELLATVERALSLRRRPGSR